MSTTTSASVKAFLAPISRPGLSGKMLIGEEDLIDEEKPIDEKELIDWEVPIDGGYGNPLAGVIREDMFM